MHKIVRKRRFSAAVGVVILVGGLSGCSLFSTSNAPVDCDVVKVQASAGKSDTQIASDLGAPVDKVAACHGPETANPKGAIPSNY